MQQQLQTVHRWNNNALDRVARIISTLANSKYQLVHDSFATGC